MRVMRGLVFFSAREADSMVVHASNGESSFRTGAAAVAIGLPCLFGGLFGAAFAVAGWDGPWWMNAVSGGIRGALPQGALAGLVAWHAFAIADADGVPPHAPIWGLIPAGLIGGLVGLGLGGLIGFGVGHAADGAIIGGFGLIGGPIAWQAVFWGVRFARDRAGSRRPDPSDGGLFVDGTGYGD
ncbi:MAG: hypothetical protein FJ297_02150 [Planctomycetes bacterium]|nr:hypothetical protein [Planctomycetota bacterium]